MLVLWPRPFSMEARVLQLHTLQHLHKLLQVRHIMYTLSTLYLDAHDLDMAFPCAKSGSIVTKV